LRLSRAIAKSKNVLVLDTGSAMELNENLNITEDKIATVP
jgi:Skp family chaperone for outer membrane proteins